jgi:hypothetical protein
VCHGFERPGYLVGRVPRELAQKQGWFGVVTVVQAVLKLLETRKVRVGVFKFDLVLPGARSDQNVNRRNRDTGGTCASRESRGGTPDRIVNGEFRQQPLEILQYFFVSLATRAIP